jgi:hypothetical protein
LDSILTPHAKVRMQQRGISAAALEALLDFGRVQHLHKRGAEVVYFDKRARARLAKARLVRSAEVERLCKSYAVLGSDGIVVTVGHRYQRIPR